MNRVLLISHHFAHNRFFRSTRIHGLLKYLADYGWTPYVLTADAPPEYADRSDVIEVPYDDAVRVWKRRIGAEIDIPLKDQHPSESTPKRTLIDFALAAWSEVFAYPDPSKNWIGPALEEGRERLCGGGFSAILSSSGPSTCHIVASKLKEEFGIPWIADFRDLWTQNHNYTGSPPKKLVERRLEMRTLSGADALTTVSEPLANKLRELHPDKVVSTITNGFDPTDRPSSNVLVDKEFTISYTGKLYEEGMDPSPFFAALRTLICSPDVDPNNIRVNFYGEKEQWLGRMINEYSVRGVVKEHGTISRQEAIDAQRRAQVLLVLAWKRAEEQGIYTGKIFDYLAAQRPILSIGSKKDVICGLLSDTGAGYCAEGYDEIYTTLRMLYEKYLENGSIDYNGRRDRIDRYSHKEMARRFSEVLDRVHQHTA